MFAARVFRFLREDDGPTAVEYAIILALILVALISSITAVGNSTSGLWQNNNTRITGAIGGGS